jgi:hypothetical protein
MANIKKCDLCLKYKDCKGHDGKLINYIVFDKEGATLSEAGKKKYGADYLTKLRENK